MNIVVMKRSNLLVLLIMFIMLSSVFVYAAGSSTRSSVAEENKSKKVNETKNVEREVPKVNNRSVRELQKVNCDEPENRRERIRCRLKEHREGKLNESYDDVPEACRGVGSEQSCRVLYRNLQKCYDMEGRLKDHCFKRVIGFAKANLKDENPGERREKARDYVIALLYDLQERIEEANENGNVSDEDASAIIDLIVEIKQDILNGVTKNELKPKFQDLKSMIRALREKNADDGPDPLETDREEGG
jgi:ribosome-binding protein aMBF1 (putative translation factor)